LAFFFESDVLCEEFLQDVKEDNGRRLLHLLEIIEKFSSEELQAKEPKNAHVTYKHLLKFCLRIVNSFREKFEPNERSELQFFNFPQFECLFVALECLANLSGLFTLFNEESFELVTRKDCTSSLLSKFCSFYVTYL